MRFPALQRLDDMKVTNVASHSFGVLASASPPPVTVGYISNLVLAQTRCRSRETRRYSTAEANQEDG